MKKILSIMLIIISFILWQVIESEPENGVKKSLTQDDINGYTITYVQNSKHFNLNDNMIMNHVEFREYSKEYKYLLSETFSINQTKTIKEIVISDSEGFNSDEYGSNLGGLCLTIGGKSHILVASKNTNHEFILFHECCHALYEQRKVLFEAKYRNRWDSLTTFVSDYAKTNIEEDFAETGAYFLINYLESGIPEDLDCYDKLKLFEEFYLETR
jgi:hypothetical protein